MLQVRDEQLIAAAEAVARLVTAEDRAAGSVYPSLSRLREVRRKTTSPASHTLKSRPYTAFARSLAGTMMPLLASCAPRVLRFAQGLVQAALKVIDLSRNSQSSQMHGRHVRS